MSNSDSDFFYSSKQFQNYFKSSSRSLVLKADAPHFTILAVSDTYLNLVHKRRCELVDKGLFEAFPGSEGDPSEQNSVYGSFMRVIGTAKNDELPIFKYEIPTDDTGKKETYYWTNLNEPVLDEDTGDVAYIINTTTNITGRIRLEQAVEESRIREQSLNEELKSSNEKLTDINEMLSAINEELQISNDDISSLNEELRESAQQLKQMNATLSESEQRFRLMAEGSGILIGVGNQAGGVTYFNHSWTELTGKSMKDLLAFGWAELIHSEDKAAYVNLYMDSLEKRVPFTGEFRILNRTGEYRWLLAFASPRFNTDGSFAGYIGSFIDITERKQDEQRKNDFISMVSHELKTPLTSINGYIQVLQGKARKSGDELASVMLDKANKQAAKMTTLINGFLNVSRLESGQIYIDRKRFDLAELIKEAEEETLAQVSSHQVVFAPVVTTIVKADRDKIGQVITNLISNAVKYSPPGSTINIACVTEGEKALVSVQDEGMGLSQEELPKLFERYYRSKDTEKQHIAGFGIGLYLCFEIIKRHEGNIWAESGPGKGSTFYFTLPVIL